MPTVPHPYSIIPIKAPAIITTNSPLFDAVVSALKVNNMTLQNRDILTIAETVAGICEGRVIDIRTVTAISEKATQLAQQYRLDPREVELILGEADKILGGLPGLILTEKNGILIANAGIDKSNAGPEFFYALWPKDPFKTAERLREQLMKHFNLQELGIIISDSRVHPLRRGVIGVAIGVAGFEPIDDCRGRIDLYGNTMKFTTRAIADQLSDAIHVVMGECDERIPFVLIRDAPVNFTNQKIDPKSMSMPFEQDLFIQILGGNSNYEKIIE
jgi:coenzyme F420-0:L-glutamate ligase